MHVILLHQLGQRLLAIEGGQGYLGLERRAVVPRGRLLILHPARGQHGRCQIGNPPIPAVQIPRIHLCRCTLCTAARSFH